jgi:hypothetical protein
MGKVTDQLIARIRRQVQERGLVLWLDPERIYAGVPDLVQKDGLQVERYEGSYFELRHRIESRLSNSQPPKLVLYLPLGEEALTPLAEVAAAGVVMRPGEPSITRNTRLSVIARPVLDAALPAATVDSVGRQADSGALSLADLDKIAEGGGIGGPAGVLGLIFGSTNPAEIALSFLGSDSFDQELVAKTALGEMAAFLHDEFGLEAKDYGSTATLREFFGRQLQVNEFITALGRMTPSKWQRLVTETPGLGRGLELVRIWRRRTDLRSSYIAIAKRVENDFDFASLDVPLDTLCRIDTFQSLEENLQTAIERAELENPAPELLKIATERLNGFWAGANPEIMDRWALIVAIGRLLEATQRAQTEIVEIKLQAVQLIRRYVEGKVGVEPWCAVDTLHRQMERHVHTFEFHQGGGHEFLTKLIAKGRANYAEMAAQLSQRFLNALKTAQFKVDKIPHQTEIYRRFVVPALQEGKTAYLLVDALRYEMALELKSSFTVGQGAELHYALGTLPSITEVGMAALLPRADQGVELVSIGEGRLGLQVDGRTMRNRTERLAYLGEAADCIACDLRLDDLLPTAQKIRERIANAQLVVVTATDELDGLCERSNVAMARRLMDDILLQLRRGIRVLFEMGVKSVIVSSDHGFLFAETLDSANLIDPPGGQTADLHRRVWVGRGGAASESYLRLKAGQVGLGGDLEIALPWSLGGFKAGGGSTYFHGAASPQELILPILVVRQKPRSPEPLTKAQWRLTPGSKTISARFLSVQIDGEAKGLVEFSPPAVRLEVREGSECLSRPVASSYGFQEATSSAKLKMDQDNPDRVRPNTVTLMLEKLPSGRQVDLYLIDVANESELVRVVGLPVSLAAF